MIALDLVSIAVLLPVMQWLVLTLHECGHAIGGVLSGLRLREIRIGSRSSRPLVFRAFGVRWVLHLLTPFPYGGMTSWYSRTQRPWRLPKLATSLSGPLGTVIAFAMLAAVFLLLGDDWPQWLQRSYLGAVITIGVIHSFAYVFATFRVPGSDLRQAHLALTIADTEIDEILAWNDLRGRVDEVGERISDGTADQEVVETLLSLPTDDLAVTWLLEYARFSWIAESEGWRAGTEKLESLERSEGFREAQARGVSRSTMSACWIEVKCLEWLDEGLTDLPSHEGFRQRKSHLRANNSAHEADTLAAIAAWSGNLERVRELFKLSVHQHNANWISLAPRLCWLAFAEQQAGRSVKAVKTFARAKRMLPESGFTRTFERRLGS